ncbi:MAG: exonuclease SbcCD subunit D C-terminal domain-containing protein [Planctomycetota bacterium]
MLKVLHTADWHLGQSFFGFDRDYEHGQFLDWLLSTLISEQPDVLLVSGDVFDSINPSAAAQKRYYNFLAGAHAGCPKLQIVIIAGNHDAGARLEAPSDLLESLNITLVGTVHRSENGAIDHRRFLVPLRDHTGVTRAVVVAIPFLRPADVPLIADAKDPYLDGIRLLYHTTTEAARQMRAGLCPDGPILAMGHCHLHGAAESSDSERRLVVGGAEALNEETFPSELAYVALGHLHKAQAFGNGRIQYSGSPLPLSFAELRYPHQILKLRFRGPSLASAESLLVPSIVPLVTVPESGSAPLAEILHQLRTWPVQPELPQEQYPFLEVRIREHGPDPTRRQQIENALDGKPLRLSSIKIERQGHNHFAAGHEAERFHVQMMSPEEVFRAAYQERFGNDAEEPLIQAFREILLQGGLDT